jgi:hypothetical protein
MLKDTALKIILNGGVIVGNGDGFFWSHVQLSLEKNGVGCV